MVIREAGNGTKSVVMKRFGLVPIDCGILHEYAWFSRGVRLGVYKTCMDQHSLSLSVQDFNRCHQSACPADSQCGPARRRRSLARLH